MSGVDYILYLSNSKEWAISKMVGNVEDALHLI